MIVAHCKMKSVYYVHTRLNTHFILLEEYTPIFLEAHVSYMHKNLVHCTVYL